MEEFLLVIDFFFYIWERAYDFFTEQHPIVQMVVFLPAALLVINLFIGFLGRNERSL